MFLRKVVTEWKKKKMKLLMEHWVSDAPVGVYTDAIDFVEMIWNELKNSSSGK